MTDDDELDDILEQSPTEALANFRRDVRTNGLKAAYEAALAVCRDADAPAPARATMAGLLLRAAGVLTKVEADDDIPIEQMTAAQMAARFKELEAEAAQGGQIRPPPRRRRKASPSAFD